MSIIGLTDRPILRRDGKIRSGYKEEGTNKLVNTDHFLLHDAPQLQGIFGETVDEIHFTVHSDNPTDFMKTDLRWYNSSQLLCLSMHNAPGEQGQNLGSVAGYFGMNDVQGLKHQPFPGLAKARMRQCTYKSCPSYVQGQCTEHMFFDMIVPQYSMGALFTLDSTSINAIINAHSTFAKAWTRYGGKLTGQIFKMYKKPGEISYQKKDGSTGKREAPMIYFDMVNFEEYEAKYKSSIRSEDWDALMNLRLRQFAMGATQSVAIAPPVESLQLGGPEESAGALPAPVTDPDEAIKVLANDPTFVKLANDLATLKGMDIEKDAAKIAGIRMATARTRPDLKSLVDYMQKQIKEAKKQQQATTPPPEPQQDTAASAPAGGLY